MLFPLQVKAYKGVMSAIKLATKIIPMPKPTLFSGAGASLELCDAIAQMGIKRVMVVTDSMLVKLGLLKVR
ncbi:hypothetical protein [uncultured Kiloniella sp.]|uniref:hypothetical protein n=1 Tax=uncultured Kiloniella sp. TaxID=1133091 RepID=UPI0026065E14|nr:hypothetical protein [uncultured Kiloniella sp.]